MTDSSPQTPPEGAPSAEHTAPHSPTTTGAPGYPEQAATAPHERRRVVAATVIWGVIVTLLALGALSLALGATFDLGLALIVVLTVGGIALLIGAVTGAARRRRRDGKR